MNIDIEFFIKLYEDIYGKNSFNKDFVIEANKRDVSGQELLHKMYVSIDDYKTELLRKRQERVEKNKSRKERIKKIFN